MHILIADKRGNEVGRIPSDPRMDGKKHYPYGDCWPDITEDVARARYQKYLGRREFLKAQTVARNKFQSRLQEAVTRFRVEA